MKPKREKKKRGALVLSLFMLAIGFTGGMGAAGGLAAYFSELPLPLITPPTRDGGRDIAKQRERERRETLEFHNLLRQDRRDDPSVPGLESAPNAADSTSPPSGEIEPAAALAKPERAFVYHLQVGAFGSRDAAETLRGEMALNGREAAVRPDNPESPRSWRVQLGPFADERAAEEQRALLALEGHNNILLLKTVVKTR